MATVNYDFVDDVLDKLKSGRVPGATVVKKAIQYYVEMKEKLISDAVYEEGNTGKHNEIYNHAINPAANYRKDEHNWNKLSQLTAENRQLKTKIIEVRKELYHEREEVIELSKHKNGDIKEAAINRHEKDIANELSELKEENRRLKMKGNPEHSETENSRTLQKQKEMNRKLSEVNGKLEDQIHELRNRLSVLAGHKLTSGNPYIADLSDAYRPTNIAEQFRQVYDDEWTQAYEDLEKLDSHDETVIIGVLSKMLKDVEDFCADVSHQQYNRLKELLANEITYPKYQHQNGTVTVGRHRTQMSTSQEEHADKLLKDSRKSFGILSTGPLTQIFQQVQMTRYEHSTNPIPSGINAYLAQSIKLVWMMKMQHPTMDFMWAEPEEHVNKAKFTFYTKSGAVVKQCVWPALVLHTNGPLMSKGIVQPM